MTYHTPATSPNPVRVFLLVEVRLYRDGIVHALSEHQCVEVVGSAPVSAADSVQQIQDAGPDILLIESSAMQDDGLRSLASSIAPPCRIVAFGILNDGREVIQCAENGVAGFVSREASLNQLVEIILSVARGEFSCSPGDWALLLRRIRNLAAERRREAPSSLTQRERQVISLVDDGLSNKDIARRLGIEVSTVKNHIHNILSKLHATRRSQAASRVRRTFASTTSPGKDWPR